MKTTIRFLFCFFACFTAYASNPNMFFTLTDFSINPATNRTVVVQSMSVPTVNSGSVILGNPITNITDTNGMFEITNAATNMLYQITVKAPPSMTAFKIYVPGGITGSNNGAQYLVADSTSTFPAGLVAWAAITSDNKYLQITNLIPGSGITIGTNGLQLTLNATGGGGGGTPYNTAQFQTNNSLVQVKAGATVTNITTKGLTNTTGDIYLGNGPSIALSNNNMLFSDGTGTQLYYQGQVIGPVVANGVSLGTYGFPFYGVHASLILLGGNDIDTYFPHVANNLSDLASIPAARNNLGLGTAGLYNLYQSNGVLFATNGQNLLIATNGAFAASSIGTNVLTPGIGSAALYPSNVFASSSAITNLNYLYVSTNGNDATAVRGDPTHPYANFYTFDGVTRGGAAIAATNGDTIFVLPGSYSIPLIPLANGVTLSGIGRPTITHNTNFTVGGTNFLVNLANNGCWLAVGNNVRISGIRFVSPYTNFLDACFGNYFATATPAIAFTNTPFTNVVISDCEIIGITDCIFDTGPDSYTLINCDIESGWDTFNTSASVTQTLINCRVVSTGDTLLGNGASRAMKISGTVLDIGSLYYATTTNSGNPVLGTLYAASSSKVTLVGTTLIASNGVPVIFNQGTTNIVGTWNDGTNVVHTTGFTYLDGSAIISGGINVGAITNTSQTNSGTYGQAGTGTFTGANNFNTMTAQRLDATNGIIDRGPTTNLPTAIVLTAAGPVITNIQSGTDGQTLVYDAATAGGVKATNFPASGGGSAFDTTQFSTNNSLVNLGPGAVITNTTFRISGTTNIQANVAGGSGQTSPMIYVTNSSGTELFSVGNSWVTNRSLTVVVDASIGQNLTVSGKQVINGVVNATNLLTLFDSTNWFNQSTNGISLKHLTEPSSGSQGYSPNLLWSGMGYNSGTGFGERTEFRSYVRPIQSTGSPTNELIIEGNVNSNGWSNAIVYRGNGMLFITNSLSINTNGPGTNALNVAGGFKLLNNTVGQSNVLVDSDGTGVANWTNALTLSSITSTGSANAKLFRPSGSNPTITTNQPSLTGAATLSAGANDSRGQINFTTTGSAQTTNTKYFTITFTASKPAADEGAILYPRSIVTSVSGTPRMFTTNFTATTFEIWSANTAISGSTTYDIFYNCFQ